MLSLYGLQYGKAVWLGLNEEDCVHLVIVEELAPFPNPVGMQSRALQVVDEGGMFFDNRECISCYSTEHICLSLSAKLYFFSSFNFWRFGHKHKPLPLYNP